MDLTLLPLSELLAGERDGSHTVAIANGEPVTLGQLRADVLLNARRFDGAADRNCILLSSDSYLFLVGLLALLQANLTVVIPANAQPETLASLAGEAGTFLSEVPIDGVNAAMLLRGSGDPGPLPAIPPKQRSVAFYTSGSTGTPKRVVRQIAHLEREVELVDTVLSQGPRPSSISATVPHQHAYGIMFKLLWPLAAGVPFSTVNHDFLESLVEELRQDSLLVTSPSHLSRLGGLPPLPPSKRPARVMSAGAPLAAPAAREAAVFFDRPVTEIFGSTETGAFATRQSDGDDTPWCALGGVRATTADDGRLKVWSPAVTGDGWFQSEDLIEMHASGTFRFLGRADRIVKLEGKRISLLDVESQLCRHPCVQAARVAVVGHGYRRLGAAVVLSADGHRALDGEGRLALREALRRHLLQTQEPAGVPRVWRFVDTLPAGALGKIADRDIEALFDTGKV